MIGPMGSGKTLRFFAPVIRRWAGPVIATSTKADLVELTLDARRRDDRPVYVFDPQGIAPSLPKFRWSPIAGASSTETAMMRAKALVAGSRIPGAATQSSEGSAFYKGQAAKVLAAILHAAALDGANLDQMLAWARKLSDPAPLGILAAHPGAGSGWADMLRTSTTGDSRTVGNTAVTLEAALEPLAHQSVVEALRGDGEEPTDFREILDAGGTVYLLGKDSEVNSVAPLTTAVTEDLFDIAEAHATASPAGRLDPPLLGALDEAPNIAPIPSLRQRVADGRGRGITVIIGLQGWASARSRFGEDTANELASYTNNVVVFGGSKDPAFLRDMSDLCGQVERTRETKTTTNGDRGGQSTATHFALEAVLRSDEIKALEEGQALVLADNLPPVITRLDGMWTWNSWPEIQSQIHDLRRANAIERARQAAEQKKQAEAHAAAWANRQGAVA
ncbi:type IV secretory system conjugative DNA transfer family protein [Streptomyces sp. UNOC14_S4]|uniref:type IV secretory system conjugative DNA transfer family protein n=1 Tax=Streptomyces sp. UNOC14_S4 TaxID=2872340 RepID=UPI001E3B2CFA|nr:TraM recognition domain-containing protein [Streptomyces sp. UNOC14_S4]